MKNSNTTTVTVQKKVEPATSGITGPTAGPVSPPETSTRALGFPVAQNTRGSIGNINGVDIDALGETDLHYCAAREDAKAEWLAAGEAYPGEHGDPFERAAARAAEREEGVHPSAPRQSKIVETLADGLAEELQGCRDGQLCNAAMWLLNKLHHRHVARLRELAADPFEVAEAAAADALVEKWEREWKGDIAAKLHVVLTAEAVEEAEYVAAGGHAFESAADRNYLRRLRALRKESEETLEPWQRAELQRTAKKFGDDWWQVKRTPTAGA